MLIAHTGSKKVDRDALERMKAPAPTQTHYPIPHFEMFMHVARGLTSLGMHIAEEEHAVSSDGNRYFGAVKLESKASDDFCLALGVRNSHDKSFPGSMALGQSVFVCDNLSFSSEVVIDWKHTKNILRDLPGLVMRGLEKLTSVRGKIAERVEKYKSTLITDQQAHDLAVCAYRNRIIPGTSIFRVIDEWHSPSHDEFRPRNLWSLHNAFTEDAKGTAPSTLQRRTIALAGMLDGYAASCN